MKQPLTSNPFYHEPYIIHDVVTVYDKSINQFVDRHRTVGVSFSKQKQIIVATTICSALDTFDRKKGTNIVRSRINTALKSNFKRRKNVLHFETIKDFELYCDRFDDMSKLMFVPYEVSHKVEQTVTRVRLVDPKCRNSDVKSPSQVYLNSTYIRDTYTKFFYSEKEADGQQAVQLCGAGTECPDAD